MLIRSSWRIGSIAGIEIAIHPTWLVIYALFAYAAMLSAHAIADMYGVPLSTRNGFILGLIAALVLFACVVAHEFAHAVVARRLGIPIGNITLFLFGGVASILREPGTPADEIKMAAAGPLASIALAVVFAGLAAVTGRLHWSWVFTLCTFLAGTNLVLGRVQSAARIPKRRRPDLAGDAVEIHGQPSARDELQRARSARSSQPCSSSPAA